MQSERPSAAHDPFAALRSPYVRAFTLGRMAAAIGTRFVSVAVGWELYERTGDPWALGLVGVVQVAPALVLMLPAGSIADRFSRRNVAIWTHAVLIVVALGLALVSRLGAPVELIYGLLMLGGVARAFASPSVSMLLAQLLRPGRSPTRTPGWCRASSSPRSAVRPLAAC